MASDWMGLLDQPIRRRLCHRAGRRGAVPACRDPTPVDPGDGRARCLYLHHDRDAGHAGDPERDPDALVRHHTLCRAGSRSLDGGPLISLAVVPKVIAGISHKGSYRDIAVVMIGGTLVALITIIVLGLLFGSF